MNLQRIQAERVPFIHVAPPAARATVVGAPGGAAP